MHRRSGLAKAGAVAFGASAALLLSALPAAADDTTARLETGTHADGLAVNVGQGHNRESTTLFNLTVGDGDSTLQAYCVEISVKIDPERSLSETPWDKFPNPDSPFHENRDKINWVLQHGYPAVDLGGIEDKLDVEFRDGLSKKEAIAATQAAVWHYSDGKDLSKTDPTPGARDSGKDVLAVYEYLTGDENTGISEPNPSLSVSPESVSGKAGERLGPFTVSTTGSVDEIVSELPEGVTITDSEGNALDAAAIEDGSEIYVDVPEDAEEGSGAFKLNGTAHVDTGRLFVSEGYDKKPAQSLIVAASDKHKLSTGANVDWQAAPQETTPPEETTTTPAPSTTPSEAAPAPTTEAPVSPQANSGDLAETGVSIMTPILIGAALVAAGAGALLLQRRRKSA
ncbi:thioester domain-containing protein [Saccharomonospora sp. NPDC006951]